MVKKEIFLVKYENGNIVLLKDGRTVYISMTDQDLGIYHVSDCDNSDNCFTITDDDIFNLVVSA